MRRENRKDFNGEGLDFKSILYISGSILAIALIGFIVTFFIYGNSLEDDTSLGRLDTTYEQNTETTSSDFGKTVNEMENDITKYAVNTSGVEENVVHASGSKQTNTDSKSKTNTSSQNKTDNKTQTTKDPEFKLPVNGEVMTEFAKEDLVYSNTLQEWIVHNGMDIKAEKTTVVKASADGTVKSIKNDPRYGLTVVIEHTNGFSTVYSNLLTAEFVVKGETVKQGQTIGTVGTTASFEISDEPHLHFKRWRKFRSTVIY